MGTSVTILDIAKETGFSANTVSRALRDMPDISEKTKEIIRNMAEQMGYTKNILASTLRTNRSQTIGVVMPDIQNPVFSGFYQGIENVCKQNGMTIFFMNSNENPDDEVKAVAQMISHKVDGVILCPSQDGNRGVDLLEASRMPYVLLARTSDNRVCNGVILDDFYGGYLACEHLISKGYTTFLQLCGARTISSFRERSKGFEKCMTDYNVPLKNTKVIETGWTWKDAYNVTKKMVRNGDFPYRAIFAFSDIFSIGVIKALGECGIRVPEDVAVIGFDNIEIGDMVSPSLTTVDIRMVDMGARSAHLMLKVIENDDAGAKQSLTLKPRLVARRST